MFEIALSPVLRFAMDDLSLKLMLPVCDVPTVNGTAKVAMTSHANGESYLMLQVQEPTDSGVLFLTPQQADTLAKQLLATARRLESGTIKVSFEPTASSRSSP